jgi:hypothetical protein
MVSAAFPPSWGQAVEQYTYERPGYNILTSDGVGAIQYPHGDVVIPPSTAVVLFTTIRVTTGRTVPIRITSPSSSIFVYLNGALAVSGHDFLTEELRVGEGKTSLTVILHGGSQPAKIAVAKDVELLQEEITPDAPTLDPLVFYAINPETSHYTVKLTWGNSPFASAWEVYRAPTLDLGVITSCTENVDETFTFRLVGTFEILERELLYGADFPFGWVVSSDVTSEVYTDITVVLHEDATPNNTDWIGRRVFQAEKYEALAFITHAGNESITYEDDKVGIDRIYLYKVTAFGAFNFSESEFSPVERIFTNDRMAPQGIDWDLNNLPVVMFDGQDVAINFLSPPDADFAGVRVYGPYTSMPTELAPETALLTKMGSPLRRDQIFFAVEDSISAESTFIVTTFDVIGNEQTLIDPPWAFTHPGVIPGGTSLSGNFELQWEPFSKRIYLIPNAGDYGTGSWRARITVAPVAGPGLFVEPTYQTVTGEFAGDSSTFGQRIDTGLDISDGLAGGLVGAMYVVDSSDPLAQQNSVRSRWLRTWVTATSSSDEPSVVPLLDQDGAEIWLIPNKNSQAKAVRWARAVGTVQAPPTSPSLAVVQAGAVTTAEAILVYPLQGDPPFADEMRIVVGVLPYTNEDGTGTEGALRHRQHTYRTADQAPMLSWYPLPAGAGKHRVRLILVDDGDQVALFHRHHLEGATPPTFTRSPGSGFASDPLSVDVEMDVPEEGQYRILEAYGIDSEGTRTSRNLVLRLDAYGMPSLVLSARVNDAGEVFVTPTSPLLGTGSWRFRAAKTAFTDPIFSDVSNAEWRGSTATLGQEIALSPNVIRLQAGETVYLSGWGFVTTNIAATAQQSSLRSSVAREIISRAGGIHAPTHNHSLISAHPAAHTWTINGAVGMGGIGPVQARILNADGSEFTPWTNTPFQVNLPNERVRPTIYRVFLRDSSSPPTISDPAPLINPGRDYIGIGDPIEDLEDGSTVKFNALKLIALAKQNLESVIGSDGRAKNIDLTSIALGTLDNITDGTTKRTVTVNEKTGAGRAWTALNASNQLTTAVVATATIDGTAASIVQANAVKLTNRTQAQIEGVVGADGRAKQVDLTSIAVGTLDNITEGTTKRTVTVNEKTGAALAATAFDTNARLVTGTANRTVTQIEGVVGTDGRAKNIDLTQIAVGTLDNITDGTTKRTVTVNEKTGAGRAWAAIDSANLITTGVLSTALIGGQRAADVATQHNGVQLIENPEFDAGIVGWNAYNNTAGSGVSIAVVNDAYAPNGSAKILRVTTSGAASPGLGGFAPAGFDGTLGPQVMGKYRPGALLVWKIRAKIRVGLTLQVASNATGDGSTVAWVSPRVGTGAWEEYSYVRRVGLSGNFHGTGHLFVERTDGSSDLPVSWDVARVSVVDANQAQDSVRDNAGLPVQVGLAGRRALTGLDAEGRLVTAVMPTATIDGTAASIVKSNAVKLLNRTQAQVEGVIGTDGRAKQVDLTSIAVGTLDNITEGTTKRTVSVSEKTGAALAATALDANARLVTGTANRTVTQIEGVVGTDGRAKQVDLTSIAVGTLDNITDGTTKRTVTVNEKTGAGRAWTALNASNQLTTAVVATATIDGTTASTLKANALAGQAAQNKITADVGVLPIESIPGSTMRGVLAAGQHGSYIRNGTFADWPAANHVPIGYEHSHVNSSWFTRSGGGQSGDNLVQFYSIGGGAQFDGYIGTAWDDPTSCAQGIKIPDYVMLEVDVYWYGGNIRGAGYIVDWMHTDNTGLYRTYINLWEHLGDTPPVGRHSVKKLVARPAGINPNAFGGFRTYLVGNWTGFAGGGGEKHIAFDRVDIRPPTVEEVRTARAFIADRRLHQGVEASDGASTKKLPKGATSISVRNGQSVVFEQPYENVPLVIPGPGATMEQRSRWGSVFHADNNGGIGGPGNAAPTGALIAQAFGAEVSASGFTARLRLVAKGDPTVREALFTTPTFVLEGAPTGPATPASAHLPGVGDLYTALFSVQFSALSYVRDGAGSALVSLELSTNGGAWYEEVGSKWISAFVGPGGVEYIEDQIVVTRMGLSGTNIRWRMRLKTDASLEAQAQLQAGRMRWTQDATVQYASATPGGDADAVNFFIIAQA